MQQDVPLVIPEVNAAHLHCSKSRAGARSRRVHRDQSELLCDWPGARAKPLAGALRHRDHFVTTMQAISGAGYPGVPSLDILGNVVPSSRTKKRRWKPRRMKLLGSLTARRFVLMPPDERALQPGCRGRRPHRECFDQAAHSGHAVSRCLRRGVSFEPLAQHQLPTAPAQPVAFLDGGRPSAASAGSHARRRDGATVGRLRPCSLLDWKFTALSHNTIRGAAGAALLNAELLHADGQVERHTRLVLLLRRRPSRHEARRHEVRRHLG